MGLPSTLRRIYAGLGVVGGVFGVASWEDDARAWMEWANVNPVLAGAFMGAGAIIVLHWVVWETADFRKRRRNRSAAGLPLDAASAARVADAIYTRRARDEEIATWRASPGNGRLAAKLIVTAPDFEEARKIWDGFCYTIRRRDPDWAYFAIMLRHTEEESEDFSITTDDFLDDFEDISSIDRRADVINEQLQRWKDGS